MYRVGNQCQRDTGTASNNKSWNGKCEVTRQLYLPPPRDEREKRRRNNPQAPGLNISLRRRCCQSQDSIKNRLSNGWSSCYEGGNKSQLSSLRSRVKIQDDFIISSEKLIDESCSERGHTESQTPSTGLRHPSFGGRCRKAMLGVWGRISAAADLGPGDSDWDHADCWSQVQMMISPTAVRMVFRKKPTLCAYIHTLGPQSHRVHFNSVREVYVLKPVARRENYPLEICLTGDDVSNGRRRHRFFTETNNKSV